MPTEDHERGAKEGDLKGDDNLIDYEEEEDYVDHHQQHPHHPDEPPPPPPPHHVQGPLGPHWGPTQAKMWTSTNANASRAKSTLCITYDRLFSPQSSAKEIQN